MNEAVAFVHGMGVGALLTTVALALVVAAKPDRPKQDDSDRREVLRRDSDYIEVINEHDESDYGVAVRDMDLGPQILAYTDSDEIYQEVSLNNEDVAPLADALSVRAVKRQRDGDGSGL